MNPIQAYFDERIARGEMGHAYLIEAPGGPGRLQLARRIAARLLCENGTGCGTCTACRTVRDGNHPDVVAVTHEKPKVISVDEIRRQLIEDMGVLPYRAACKIYLVDEAEKMNPNAQNALLKTLEEPPAYGIILLLTENRNTMLPTILSRVVTVSGENCEAEEGGEEAGAARLFEYLHRIRVLPVAEMAGAAAALKEAGQTPERTLVMLRRILRDIMCRKAGAGQPLYYPEEAALAEELAEELTEGAIGRLWDALSEADARLKANVSPDTVWELFLMLFRSEIRAVRIEEDY